MENYRMQKEQITGSHLGLGDQVGLPTGSDIQQSNIMHVFIQQSCMNASVRGSKDEKAVPCPGELTA